MSLISSGLVLATEVSNTVYCEWLLACSPWGPFVVWGERLQPSSGVHQDNGSTRKCDHLLVNCASA